MSTNFTCVSNKVLKIHIIKETGLLSRHWLKWWCTVSSVYLIIYYVSLPFPRKSGWSPVDVDCSLLGIHFWVVKTRELPSFPAMLWHRWADRVCGSRVKGTLEPITSIITADNLRVLHEKWRKQFEFSYFGVDTMLPTPFLWKQDWQWSVVTVNEVWKAHWEHIFCLERIWLFFLGLL